VDQLNKIFSAPLYRGCLNAGRWYKRPGKLIPKTAGRYWVPLVALFTGMRSNEICQLDVADIIQKDGVDFIVAQVDGGKSVKTKAGEREVPVHPELKRLGFIAYAEFRRKEGAKRLFPDLKKAKSGYYSDIMQKWFGNFLRSLDLKKPGVVLHSFRHTFRDAMREADVNVEVQHRIGGWELGQNTTANSYGRGHSPKRMLEEISKVKFPGLKLPKPAIFDDL
jgi:integrase